jgi:large subunit ribosomal protein L23
MTPLRIFKRKKIEEKKEVPKKKEEVKEKKVQEKKEAIKKEAPKKEEKILKAKKTALPRIAWRVIKTPHVTEKATLSEEDHQYVFKVFPNANKTEVKKAIEEIYGVKVEKVRIINVPGKKRRRGRIEGWKKGYKKAIVKIKEGQKIEILSR